MLMKIIVDTKEDSKEQIKMAAQFLLTIAEGAQQEFSAEAPEGAFGMFDQPKPKKPFNINQLQEY